MAYTELELFYLLIGFAKLQPVNLLEWPTHISTDKIHHFLLHSVFLSPHFLSYPPSLQYQRNFWKWVLENLENAQKIHDFEVDPRFYERYLELLAASGPFSTPEKSNQIYGPRLPLIHQPPVDSYVTYFWRSLPHQPPKSSLSAVDFSEYRTATLLESRRLIESGTTGLRTWGASLVLAHYLSENSEVVDTRRVLELGSGVGFLGIVVASLQLQHAAASSCNNRNGALYLTDINEEVLARCKKNIVLPCNCSSIHPNVHVQKLDWSASLDNHQRCDLASYLEHDLKPDVILGADIVYDPSLIPALVGVLRIALRKKDKEDSKRKVRYALIALALRNRATTETFISRIQDECLCISDISSHIERTYLDVLCEDDVHLYEITTK